MVANSWPPVCRNLRNAREVRAKAYPAGPDDDYPFTIRVLERA